MVVSAFFFSESSGKWSNLTNIISFKWVVQPPTRWIYKIVPTSLCICIYTCISLFIYIYIYIYDQHNRYISYIQKAQKSKNHYRQRHQSGLPDINPHPTGMRAAKNPVMCISYSPYICIYIYIHMYYITHITHMYKNKIYMYVHGYIHSLNQTARTC